MHSDDVSIKVSNLQLNNGGRPLFLSPITMHCITGVLNIIVGANGTGKSTILDILALRKKEPDDTEVCRKGHENSIDIAYLPQAFLDIFDIRVQDICYLAHRRLLFGASVEYPPPFKVPISSRTELGALSGGQRQLLLFWLVFIQPVHVHIYDEPFRHLDNEASSYVKDSIERQVKEGKLLIISEHSSWTEWAVPCNRIILDKQRSQSITKTFVR